MFISRLALQAHENFEPCFLHHCYGLTAIKNNFRTERTGSYPLFPVIERLLICYRAVYTDELDDVKKINIFPFFS